MIEVGFPGNPNECKVIILSKRITMKEEKQGDQTTIEESLPERWREDGGI